MAVEIGKERAIEQAGDRLWNARTAGEPQARYLSPSVISGMYLSSTDRYSVSLTNAVDLINRPESGDFTLARLTLLDRINPKLPVTKIYDHDRSEERRVGKAWRGRGGEETSEKNEDQD